ncbi:MAG: D-inositol-3-phosphate glycosyltransferase [Chlamydiales bacterium]|nr:D-inositol-3-phosphate glycosyltransferase [Chlamydiales bacterium]
MTSVVLLKSRLSHRGGLEKYTRRLAEAFEKKGCAVTILTTGEPSSWNSIEVISLAPTSKFSLYHLRRFDLLCKKWLQKHPQEVVFGMERTSYQTHYRAGSGVHACYLKRRLLTDSWFKRLSFRFNPLHRYLLQVEKNAFEAPTLQALFTNSHLVKREILDTYATPAEKIHVVHNGVEWTEKEAPFQATFQKPRSGPYHFLFVGNGFKRKGLEFLLKGLATFQAPFQLTVVGKDKNLSYYKKLAYGLPVRFVGSQKEVTPFYQAADALVIPSIYDPFSNVTLEALAMGLFVVSSTFNGGHEVLGEQSGTLIQNLNQPQEALARALQFPKTPESASRIRQSIKELDFSKQLDKIVRLTL